MQPAHAAGEDEPGLVIAPVAVEQVAGDDDEIDPVLDRCIDQIVERTPTRLPEGRRQYLVFLD